MSDSCQTCRFWLAASAEQGLCRRNPPTPVYIPERLLGEFTGLRPENVIATFPAMTGEGWCGEYKRCARKD